MIDGGGGAATLALSQTQKQLPDLSEKIVDFKDVLNQMSAVEPVGEIKQPREIGKIQDATRVQDLTQVQNINKIDAESIKTSDAQNEGAKTPDKHLSTRVVNEFENSLDEFNQNKKQIDGMLTRFALGEQPNVVELLVLQNAIYRSSFALESMAKIVETGTGAIKQTMQTQV